MDSIRARLASQGLAAPSGDGTAVDRLPATRAELLDVAAAVGVPQGQARAHLLAYAGMTGEPCMIDGRFQRVPAGRKVPHDRAAELARRYLTGHAPATAEDFAAWSGLPMTVARAAFPDDGPAVKEGAAAEIEDLNRTWWR